MDGWGGGHAPTPTLVLVLVLVMLLSAPPLGVLLVMMGEGKLTKSGVPPLSPPTIPPTPTPKQVLEKVLPPQLWKATKAPPSRAAQEGGYGGCPPCPPHTLNGGHEPPHAPRPRGGQGGCPPRCCLCCEYGQECQPARVIPQVAGKEGGRGVVGGSQAQGVEHLKDGATGRGGG